MAVHPTDPEALHLYQMIGAPMLAVVQAEAQAAQVSADFIQRIGFEPLPDSDAAPAPAASKLTATPDTSQPIPAKPSLQDGGSQGRLKFAEFRLDAQAQDGTQVAHTVRVPVLSLYPIPLLQVKHAEFDFDMRIVSRVPLSDAAEKHDPAFEPAPDFLAPSRVELKGFLTGSAGADSGVTNASRIKVRVRMEQSDLPAGLTHMLKLMGDNVSTLPSSIPADKTVK